MNKAGSIAGLAALIAFFTMQPAAAQSRIITFEEAVRIALERNATLRQSETAAELNSVAVQEARGQLFPDLRISTSTAQNYGRNFNQTEGRIIEQSSRSVNINLNSGVTIFDGFGNTASLNSAKFAETAGKLDVQRTRETVVFTVASNFLSLIQAQEQLRVRRESLQAEMALLEQIQSYVNAGARTIADLYQQQANVASAQLAVVQAERAAELAKVDLMQTLQLDPQGVYEFEAPSEAALGAADEPADLPELLERAYAKRADLEAEQARIEAAEQNIRVAKSNLWPTLSLNTSYGSGYTSVSDFSFFDQLDQRRGGSISLGITIPIFDRGATRAQTRRAELQAERARITLESLQNEIGLQVRRAYLDYRAAREQLSAAEAQLRAAELALQATNDRYRVGAATLVELSQSRVAQVQAASNVVTARFNLLFQRTLTDYYVGELAAADIAAP